jgi:hypothetical protein
LEWKTSLWSSLKWWFGWPWFKKDPANRKTYDVGRSVATAVCYDDFTFTVTRKGRYLFDYYISQSDERLLDHLHQKWILADDGIYYATKHVKFFSIKTESYLVYEDNKPVQA